MKLLAVPLTLSNANIRRENEGKSKLGNGAADLSFKATLGPKHLAQFFRNKKDWEAFRDYNWGEDGGMLRRAAIKLDQGLIGGTVKLHSELNPEYVMELHSCEIKGLDLTPTYDGNCEVKIRVQCHPNGAQVAKLYEEWQQMELRVTASGQMHMEDLEPPEEEEEKPAGKQQKDLMESQDDADKKKGRRGAASLN